MKTEVCRVFFCSVFASYLALSPAICVGQEGAQDERAISIAKKLVEGMQNCPRRELVAKSSKHWMKQAWGPPANVTFDVERTASIVHPYRITVQFSLVMSYGPDRKTREEAVSDTDLKPLLTATYRTVYDLGHDGPSIYVTQVRHGTEWTERPRWSDACWDSAVG